MNFWSFVWLRIYLWKSWFGKYILLIRCSILAQQSVNNSPFLFTPCSLNLSRLLPRHYHFMLRGPQILLFYLCSHFVDSVFQCSIKMLWFFTKWWDIWGVRAYKMKTTLLIWRLVFKIWSFTCSDKPQMLVLFHY